MESRDLDAVIIGGGPAGLAALSWCSELGLKALLLERAEEFGGQLLSIYNPITNYPARLASNGREFCRQFISTIKGLKGSVRLCSEATEIDPSRLTVSLNNGDVISARNIIVATGVRRRRLGVTGEAEFAGRGILESGAKQPSVVRGKSVAIIGGGDAALENALLLSGFARSVMVIHRNKVFRARREFLAEAQIIENIQFMPGTQVVEIRGDDRVRSLTVIDSLSGVKRDVPVDLLLVRIGVEPNSELVRGLVGLDVDGYVEVDSQCRSSVANIFAIGDVASPRSPTIISAAGMGATSAKTIAS